MEFKDIVMQRYATKKFDGRKISEEKIGELLELVRFAPSALNLQPWKIKIVTDQKIKDQLRPATNDQEQITSCSHLLVFCADPDYEGLIRRLGTLLQNQGVSEELRNHGDRNGAGFYRKHAAGTETRVVAGPDVSCARECTQWRKSARV